MAKRSAFPLISCLMLTRATRARFPLIRRNLDCYVRQSYPNKELVIVLDRPAETDRARIEREVGQLNRPDIKISCLEKTWDMGMKRNATIVRSAGEILCQWDDDDFSHPLRLETQYELLKRGRFEAVCLADLFWHDLPRKKLFLAKWATGHPGTIMMRRPEKPPYPSEGIYYPKKGLGARGEDQILWSSLRSTARTGILENRPYLYVYHFHGTNLTNATHHRRLMRLYSYSEKESRRCWPAHKGKLRDAGLLPQAPLTTFREVSVPDIR